MNQHDNLLLSTGILRRDTGLLRGQPVGDTFALKRVAAQTYLIVNPLQAGVLAEFAEPKSVPQALENCIRERKCPPLREFYDLILKAHAAGILRSEPLAPDAPAASERLPVRWFASLQPRVLTLVFCLGVLVATGLAFSHWGTVPPAGVLDVLAGWLVVCGALSLGQALAAAALRGAGCEVHHPHIHWLTLAPHFAVNQTDACMSGRLGNATIQAVTWLPLAFASILGFWLRAPWSLFPLAALFIACRPIGASPMGRLLAQLRRRPFLSTDRRPLFDVELPLIEHSRHVWRRFDSGVATVQFIASLGWGLSLGCVAYRLLHLPVKVLFADWLHWEKSLLLMAAALAVISLLWLAAVIQHRAFGTVVALWRRGCLAWRRLRHRPINPATDVALIEALVRGNPLLGRLDPEVQLELARSLQPYQSSAWRTLVSFDQEPPVVSLIVSGRASIYRRLKSGRKTRFLRVVEGDLFGAHHLIDPENASLEIRTDTPLVALTLSQADFQRLVLARLGAPAVCAYMHKHLFLQNSSPLCADWRPAAIAHFVDLAETASHSAGGRIIARGQEVPSLYVLYEGHARTRDDHKRTARLNPGDFFGEISLLQTSVATTDVETKDEARSLVVNRVEFIRFMARNHQVALQMERLCSRRLGRPIFPLERTAFSER
jgi:CRP-like cAMP-binding protein